jgi:hypothetical protein
VKYITTEDFTGVKPDISQFVPFYAKGVCHVTKEQRELMGGLTLTWRYVSTYLHVTYSILTYEKYDDIGKPNQISKHSYVNKYKLPANPRLDYKQIHKGNTTNVVLSPHYNKKQKLNGIYHENPLLLSDTLSNHLNLTEKHYTPTDVYQAIQSPYADSLQEAINTEIDRIVLKYAIKRIKRIV